jgi:2-hydroxy-6-oxonona-2,4-dienedioate hydrolase
MADPAIQMVDVGGIPTRVLIQGERDGPDIVLLHGGMPGHVPYCGGSHLWGDFARVLQRVRASSPSTARAAAGQWRGRGR